MCIINSDLLYKIVTKKALFRVDKRQQRWYYYMLRRVYLNIMLRFLKFAKKTLAIMRIK